MQLSYVFPFCPDKVLHICDHVVELDLEAHSSNCMTKLFDLTHELLVDHSGIMLD